jgi:hypothetical protein
MIGVTRGREENLRVATKKFGGAVKNVALSQRSPAVGAIGHYRDAASCRRDWNGAEIPNVIFAAEALPDSRPRL